MFKLMLVPIVHALEIQSTKESGKKTEKTMRRSHRLANAFVDGNMFRRKDKEKNPKGAHESVYTLYKKLEDKKIKEVPKSIPKFIEKL